MTIYFEYNESTCETSHVSSTCVLQNPKEEAELSPVSYLPDTNGMLRLVSSYDDIVFPHLDRRKRDIPPLLYPCIPRRYIAPLQIICRVCLFSPLASPMIRSAMPSPGKMRKETSTRLSPDAVIMCFVPAFYESCDHDDCSMLRILRIINYIPIQ